MFIIIINLVKNKGPEFQSHISLSSKNCLCFDCGLVLSLWLELGLSDESVPSMELLLLFPWPPAIQVEQNFYYINMMIHRLFNSTLSELIQSNEMGWDQEW